MVLKKDVKDKVKKIIGQGLVSIIDHALTSNMRSMYDLAILRKMINKHEK